MSVTTESAPGTAPAERQCRFCDAVWGILGIGIGALFIVVGADLLTKGKLIRGLSPRPVGDDIESDDDNGDDTEDEEDDDDDSDSSGDDE